MSILPAELKFILKYFSIKLFKGSKFGGEYAEFIYVFYYWDSVIILDRCYALGFTHYYMKNNNPSLNTEFS
jgi:hypothetical protein